MPAMELELSLSNYRVAIRGMEREVSLDSRQKLLGRFARDRQARAGSFRVDTNAPTTFGWVVLPSFNYFHHPKMSHTLSHGSQSLPIAFDESYPPIIFKFRLRASHSR
ncbi:hypothetical protein EVAR_10726_1 [Eumeta japonica]|uniref:Uncharacterized protein n=1 Tax=Eumeta variegata TaxID=151549 RepID=A0A4C1U8K8_EUMVA|nr:hypothetical protein EVAR_10726_1 [Eumeta japonica]